MAISAANLAKFRKTFGKIKDIKDTEEKPKGIRPFAKFRKTLGKIKDIKDTEEKPKGIRPFSSFNIAKIKERLARLEQGTTKKTTPRSTDASPPGFKKGGSVKKRSKSSCKKRS